MSENKTEEMKDEKAGGCCGGHGKGKGKGECCKKGGKMPLVIALIAIIAAVGGAIALNSGKGVADSEKGKEATAAADQKKAEGDEPMIKLGNPVVAIVDGKEIKRGDVFEFISQLPPNVRQMPIQQLFPMAQEQVINNMVISQKADAANLEDDQKVKDLEKQAKEQIIRNVYIQRQVDAQITPQKLQEAYQDMLKQMGKVQEVEARHILVKDEATAKKLIKELEGGADFATLAKENSTGPSAKNGGELGYFSKDQMVPEFANAAFALDKGAFTKDPVKTQFGWHIIEVEDKRVRPAPKFEQVKPQLEAQMRQKVLGELVKSWQEESKVEVFDINGDTPKADAATK